MSFDERKINHIFDVVSSANAIETTQNSMDNIVNELKEIFLEPAKVTGMYTQHNISTNNRRRKCNNSWYNNECDASKKDYKKFKKSLNKNQKDEKKKDEEKAALKALANKHKNLLRKEKRKFDKELNAKIRALKSTDPGKY